VIRTSEDAHTSVLTHIFEMGNQHLNSRLTKTGGDVTGYTTMFTFATSSVHLKD